MCGPEACWDSFGRPASVPSAFLMAVSALELGMSEFVDESFKSRVSVSYRLLALPDLSPISVQSQLCGLVFLLLVPKSGVLDVGLKPQRTSVVVISPPVSGSPH